ncbi:hypothetical protein UCD39_08980 [Nitrospirillum sp. BR 11752]|uniref:hypothetical protein n=1 Tax=Nitrospirillum sp. BR 11752 TaxID=3104293 RepID=UPI002EC39E59|nr:hypothetical protein [Nitrospirillum sp. BR 11752]
MRPKLDAITLSLMQATNAAVEKLKPAVIPIYRRDCEGRIFSHGSAVLLRIDGRTFLCTALHVIDDPFEEGDTLLLDSEEGAFPLDSNFLVSREYDVAIGPLNEEACRKLSYATALMPEDVAIPTKEDRVTGRFTFAEVSGYPASRNRSRPRGIKIKRSNFSFGANIEQIDEAEIRISFNRRKKNDVRTGNSVTSPEPYGMSGGAIFGLRLAKGENPEPKLIGISVAHDVKKSQVIGTNIGLVMEIIRGGWIGTLPSHLSTSIYNAEMVGG